MLIQVAFQIYMPVLGYQELWVNKCNESNDLRLFDFGVLTFIFQCIALLGTIIKPFRSQPAEELNLDMDME